MLPRCHVLQQEADDHRQVLRVGRGHRLGHRVVDLLEHRRVELQAAQRVEHGRGELVVLAQQLAQHVDGGRVLVVGHQVGQHEDELFLERRVDDLGRAGGA
jgi:hypothetical protein